MRSHTFLVGMTFAICLSTPGFAAGGARITLASSAEVQGDSIVLANLLANDVSRRFRAEAQQIALGAAPQPGSARVLTRGAIASAIATAGLPVDDFKIPEAVNIRRGNPAISRDKILAAIQSALARNSIAGINVADLHDLSFDASLALPSGDPGLEVTQISFDHGLGRLRFRLWPRLAPNALPFYVTATAEKLSKNNVRMSAPAPRLVSARVGFSQPVSPGPILVSPGQLARLHLRSPDLDMLLEVRPLERGRFGDVIRAQLPGTNRTFQARVTGNNYLDAAL